jgi:manganese/zinc/iron transport system ATP- binding protein
MSSHSKREVALDVSHLSVNYEKTPALWDINLSIPNGLLVAIIGPNGAGKSTFIKATLELIPSISGKVRYFGKPLKNMRQHIAYVPQRETVDWNFPITVLDLVLMGRYGKLGLLRWPRNADVVAARHYLDLVGMLPYIDRQISQLSGGQQQRIFIARALLQDADIYFMDEPFAGIDVASEGLILNLLQGLRQKGKTVFVVHHDLSTVERYFDWTILLNMRLIAYGPTQEILIPENLNLAYGKNYALFSEAFKERLKYE